MLNKIIIDNPDDAVNLRILSEKTINNTLDLKIQLEQNKMNFSIVAVLIPKQPLKSTNNDDYLTTLSSIVLKKSPVLIEYSNITTSNNTSMQFLVETKHQS
jgi:hypothetical protein